MKNKIYILILVAMMIISTGFGCKCTPKNVKEALKPVNLTYWRAWDNTDDFSEIIGAYRALHPNISINYRKLRYEEFEKELLEAYAQNRAPDIISLHQSWLPKYEAKEFIAPMPAKITMAYQVVKKSLGLKEEVSVELRDQATLTLGQLKNDFLDVVYKDAVSGGKIYGLPLGIDTMVMYYNRDLLNSAGVPLPPTNWQEFQEAIKKITITDADGNIIQAGAAVGTTENISRSTDILTLLMLQNGATMIEGGSVMFNNIPASQPDKSYNPGVEALIFYTDFANPTKEVYTWNNQMPPALTAFAGGLVGFYFGYSYDLPRILAASKGKINLGIAKIPQIKDSREVNIANYWVETVSSQSKNQNEAWDFILFATNKNRVSSFLNKTGKQTALRALVSSQLQNEQFKYSAAQLLTAQSWYNGMDANAAEEALKEMIDSVGRGGKPIEAINLAAQKVQQTMR